MKNFTREDFRALDEAMATIAHYDARIEIKRLEVAQLQLQREGHVATARVLAIKLRPDLDALLAEPAPQGPAADAPRAVRVREEAATPVEEPPPAPANHTIMR